MQILNVCCWVLISLFWGTFKSQLLLGFVFFKEKDEREVEEGKGGKEDKGELWEKARNCEKLESPHWVPFRVGLARDVVTPARPIRQQWPQQLENWWWGHLSSKTVLFPHDLTPSHTHLPQSLYCFVFFPESKKWSSGCPPNFLSPPSTLPKLLLWVTQNPRSSVPCFLGIFQTYWWCVSSHPQLQSAYSPRTSFSQSYVTWKRLSFAPAKVFSFFLPEKWLEGSL